MNKEFTKQTKELAEAILRLKTYSLEKTHYFCPNCGRNTILKENSPNPEILWCSSCNHEWQFKLYPRITKSALEK